MSEAFTPAGLAASNLFAVELVLLLAAPALFAGLAGKQRRRERPVQTAPLQRGGVAAE